MDDQNQNGSEQTEQTEQQEAQVKPARKFIRIKPFTLIMLMFLTILLTAGLTILALTFGEKKVVEVAVPVEREEFSKLYDAYDELKDKYYVEIDDEKVVTGAINGMFDALEDPYSDFMDVEEAERFNTDLSSSFQGIGAEIQERNGNIVVVSPIKNSPAEKAGILPEDIILSVDGESIQGMSASEAVLLIRGEKGTPVELTIQRGESDHTIDVKIIRDDIPIETVYGEMGDDKIAHIQITSFSEKTYDEIVKLLEEFDADGMKSIILDVRQNPGGFLESAIDIANLFLEEGKPIVQVQSREGEPEVISAKGGEKYKQPIVVLVDNGSASASEILAAALSESAGAKVVGLNSFGKGTIQTVSNLPDGANLKYTTGKWLTPEGNWINEKGIKPDVVVEYPEYATATYINPEMEITLGDSSQSVKSAELILSALGYEVGTVDKTFDQATENAVVAFQADEQLQPTGVLTGETTYALMDSIREKIEKEDPHVLKAKEILTKSTK
ncbi:PDZ domain-containing protein [Lysinibacillus yapensis]|uniref:PDZ domain-containing protein n=1 Tax=Ureibacillus yapensis TaxID=2304605 RepID=A0A396S9K3_9BACL|nr:S41 family peptidase [Lysinibacillus yapensis]RHW37574.1 PDZ domain-containing protein [Lysinibacillus yapensis]